MSTTYPQWVLDAMNEVEALCPPDAEPKLSDDEIARAVTMNQFPALDSDDPLADPRVDVYGAVRDCWVLKAGKAAGDYDFDEAGMRDHPSQVFAHCMQQADRFNPIGIA